MTTTSETIVAYRAVGSVRGDSGRIFASIEAAEAHCAKDNRDVKIGHGRNAYSDRRPVPVTQGEALSMDRVPWGLLVGAGADLEAIARDAAVHGDKVLAAKARRANGRRV